MYVGLGSLEKAIYIASGSRFVFEESGEEKGGESGGWKKEENEEIVSAMTIPRSSPPLPLLHFALVFLFASSHLKGFAAGDASQGGESASTSPGCNVTSQDVNIRPPPLAF